MYISNSYSGSSINYFSWEWHHVTLDFGHQTNFWMGFFLLACLVFLLLLCGRQNFYEGPIEWALWLHQKKYIHIIIPGTCILIYMAKDVIKLRTLTRTAYPGLSEWVLNAFSCILIKKKANGCWTDTHIREGNVNMKHRDVPRMPRNPNSLQNLEEARNGFPLRMSRESVLLTPWFQTSAFQNHERVNCYCF